MKVFKIVVVGDGAVGKSSMLLRYTMNAYYDDYQPTVFDNYSTLVRVDNHIYNITLWDTAGQEEYASLRPLSYNQTDCFIVCYSVTMHSSLENIIEKWLPELNKYAPGVPIVLAGLKSDTIDDKDLLAIFNARGIKLVTDEQSAVVANAIGAKAHVLASALTGKNVTHLIESCIRATMNTADGEKKSKKSRNPFSRLSTRIKSKSSSSKYK